MRSKYQLSTIIALIGCSLLIPIIAFNIGNVINNDNDDKRIYFETLGKGVHGGIGKRDYYLIIDSQVMWEQTWDQTFKFLSPRPVPDIDFTKTTIIAVYHGWEVTGGYSIEITKISETYSGFNVYITDTYPSSGFVTQATTMPFHIIKTQKLTKNVNFITIYRD